MRRLVDAVVAAGRVRGCRSSRCGSSSSGVFDLKPYFLPAPSAIWTQFVDNFGLVREAAVVSGRNALVGLLAGTVLGVAVSFLLMRFRLLNELRQRRWRSR